MTKRGPSSGTNYFGSLDENVNISQTNELGFAVLADCFGDPNIVAVQPYIFNTGCQMIQNDILVGENVFFNIGTLLNPVWVLGGGGGGTWTPEGVTFETVGGIISGTDLGTIPVSIADTLIQIFYPERGPRTTIGSTPPAGLYETGNSQSSIALSATTTPGSLPITTFIFKKNGTTIYTDPSPSPTGGTETYTDGSGVSSDTTYQAIVGDGTMTGTASETFSFVFAYYYGVSAPGLNISSDGGGLTKLLIADTSNITRSFTTVTNVQYFCYPASYPSLTSIKDPSGFETISLWTASIVTVTNSYGQSASYRKYEYSIPNTNTSFNFTFIQ